jgi:hypothetical protein
MIIDEWIIDEWIADSCIIRMMEHGSVSMDEGRMMGAR